MINYETSYNNHKEIINSNKSYFLLCIGCCHLKMVNPTLTRTVMSSFKVHPVVNVEIYVQLGTCLIFGGK